jgi:prepilin-type N-terminal cleavage/methylation domain-containing protein
MKVQRKGFTLIELLIVIAVIAILAASLFVALNPAKRFLDARDAKRNQDAEAIVGGLKAYQVDNNGSYPAAVTALVAGTAYTIGTNGAAGCDVGCTAKVTAAACVDATALVTGGYIGSVPKDPSTGTDLLTDYYMIKNSTGTVEVGSCDPEGGAAISVVR